MVDILTSCWNRVLFSPPGASIHIGFPLPPQLQRLLNGDRLICFLLIAGAIMQIRLFSCQLLVVRHLMWCSLRCPLIYTSRKLWFQLTDSGSDATSAEVLEITVGKWKTGWGDYSWASRDFMEWWCSLRLLLYLCLYMASVPNISQLQLSLSLHPLENNPCCKDMWSQ